jgi:cytochrome c-type biogenesis protein CcmH/NrfG
MRRRHALVIRRDDHKRDALGAVFLGAVTDPEAVRDAVVRYLGPAIRVLVVEQRPTALRVEIEATGFSDESRNLVRLGRGMAEKGRARAASDMFTEALRLDPTNADALKAEARIRLQSGDVHAAEERWILAGEIAGFDSGTLRGLADAALEEGRTPSAMRYLEEALVADPSDREVREMLDQLRRQIELRFAGDPEAGDS